MYIYIYIKGNRLKIISQSYWKWDIRENIMGKVQIVHDSKTGSNKLFLLNKLMTFKYREGIPILDQINDF